MSRHDYEMSKRIDALDFPFYALVMAAMRRADTANTEALKRAFPDVWDELQARYWAPGGFLPHELESSESIAAAAGVSSEDGQMLEFGYIRETRELPSGETEGPDERAWVEIPDGA